MKKYIIFLSILVLVGFSITGFFLGNIYKQLGYLKEPYETDELESFRLHNFVEVTEALLKVEKAVFKNNYDFFWNRSEDDTGYTHMALANQIEIQLGGYISYSCDTHTEFITPACEHALAVRLQKSHLTNRYFDWHSDDENRKILIKDKFINKFVSEKWYFRLFEQNPEINKKFHEDKCKDNQWKEQNEEQNIVCAQSLVNKYWPLERVLKEIKSTPITDYLKRNESLYSKSKTIKVYKR